MDTEQEVAKHYSHGTLEQAILAAVEAAGKDIDQLTADDLAGADEFHLGWRPATAALAADLGLAAGARVLDVGAGIGGPARFFAGVLGCQVTGIDLTAEYVEVATALTRRCGLGERATFHQGSALELPFPPGSFDAATLIHVGMNIEDKARLFAQVKRALRPGGRFGVYDIMQVRPGSIPYPMPWSPTPATSFVETPETYRRLLTAAGFTLESETDRRPMALELSRTMRAKTAAEGAPPLGLHVLMGPASKERLGNVMATLEAGIIAPTQMIALA